jgi:hypothetical protein
MAKAHLLVDNFNDDAIDNVKWTAYAAPTPAVERLRETNGRIEIRPASGATGYSGLGANLPGDLTGSYVAVELVQALPARVAGEVYLTVSKDGSNWINMAVWDGVIGVTRKVAGALSHPYSTPYDPGRHRWLRLREQGGVTYWETSPDGVAWEVLFSQANPFVLTAVTPDFGAGIWEASPSPGVAIFDNYNVLETPRSRRVEERRRSARDIRVEAAELAEARRHDEHLNNNDEVNYPERPLVGNYSKSLKHDALGDPDPASYGTLLRALQSEDPQDFEEIQLAQPAVGAHLRHRGAGPAGVHPAARAALRQRGGGARGGRAVLDGGGA